MSHFPAVQTRRPLGQAQSTQPSLVQKIMGNPLYLALIAAAGIGAFMLYSGKMKISQNPKRVSRPKKRARAKHKKSTRAKRKKSGWLIQAIHFAKNKFTRKEALKWARKNRRKAPKIVRSTKNFWDLRQAAPSKFSQFRRKSLEAGVQATFAKPKKSKKRKASKKRVKKSKVRKNMEIETSEGGSIFV